jgi:hypothetical protein
LRNFQLSRPSTHDEGQRQRHRPRDTETQNNKDSQLDAYARRVEELTGEREGEKAREGERERESQDIVSALELLVEHLSQQLALIQIETQRHKGADLKKHITSVAVAIVGGGGGGDGGEGGGGREGVGGGGSAATDKAPDNWREQLEEQTHRLSVATREVTFDMQYSSGNLKPRIRY